LGVLVVLGGLRLLSPGSDPERLPPRPAAAIPGRLLPQPQEQARQVIQGWAAPTGRRASNASLVDAEWLSSAEEAAARVENMVGDTAARLLARVQDGDTPDGQARLRDDRDQLLRQVDRLEAAVRERRQGLGPGDAAARCDAILERLRLARAELQ
jgi:hypothetical protein